MMSHALSCSTVVSVVRSRLRADRTSNSSPTLHGQQTAAVDAERLVQTGNDFRLGLLERERVDQSNVTALQFGEDRRFRRATAGLLRHGQAPILGPLLLGVTAALFNRVADAAGAGIAGSLLAEHLAGGTSHFAAGLRADSALSLVGVIHDQGLLEQSRVHFAAELGFVDRERLDLFAGLIVNWGLQSCNLFRSYWDFRGDGFANEKEPVPLVRAGLL